MNKRFKLIILSVIAAIAAAMPTAAKIHYGATVGGSLTSLSWKQDLFEVNQVFGGSAGVNAEVMFPGIGFGIGAGLQYELKGANLHMGEKYIWSSQGLDVERAFLHYIQIPINLRFKWTRMNGLEDYIAPVVYGGPTLGILAGHNHNVALDYAGADIGLEIGFGVELFKKWQVVAVRNWGMTYAVKTKQLEDFSARNRSWAIKIVYYWNKK